MAGGFHQDVTVSSQLSGGGTSGNCQGTIYVPHRVGYIIGIAVDIKTGAPTNFGIDFFSRKNGSNFYSTEANLYRLHTVASAARTEYHDLEDLAFAFVAEAAPSNTGGNRNAIHVNIAFTGAVANSLVEYDVRVIGLGVN